MVDPSPGSLHAPPLPVKGEGKTLNGAALLQRLPPVRGRLTPEAPLAPFSWFRVGGPAEVLFRPADMEDLQNLLAHCPADVPVTVLGVGSNVIIRDGGIPGVVIRLGPPFNGVAVTDLMITAGSAVLDRTLALQAAANNIAGLSFFSGIPGTIGGALRMNAGAYGRETKDVLVSATAIDRMGQMQCVSASALGLGYRHSAAPADWIYISATFIGEPGNKADIQAQIDDIAAKRAASQPIRARTGGSTFANPPFDESAGGHKAWQLIDAAGCRGLRIGGAVMSDLHCNFMLNDQDATAADLEALGEEVRRRVRDHSGVELRWEIKRIGLA